MRRLPTLAVAGAIAAALVFAAPTGAKPRPLRLVPAAQVLVDAISAEPSQVSCDLGEGQFGYSIPSLNEIYVEGFVCSRINALAAKPEAVASLPDGSRTLFRTALALSILVHESWHLAPVEGFLDEARTDCREIQTSWAFAELLGADHATAVRLGQISVTIHYLKLMFSPTYENLAKCRAGGEWDLNPTTPAWPIG